MIDLYQILNGDAVEMLRTLPDESVNCIVTSPPYWALRDYGVDGQIGLEASFSDFLARLVEVFAECKRVLAADGTLWVNMGDSYANDDKWGGSTGGKHVSALHGQTNIGRAKRDSGMLRKSLMGQPWRLAFALQDQGWYLRRDIIWHKPNPMPESAGDRPTTAHEYIFMLTKSPAYWYNSDAIAEPVTESTIARISQPGLESQAGSERANGGGKTNGNMKAVLKRPWRQKLAISKSPKPQRCRASIRGLARQKRCDA